MKKWRSWGSCCMQSKLNRKLIIIWSAYIQKFFFITNVKKKDICLKAHHCHIFNMFQSKKDHFKQIDHMFCPKRLIVIHWKGYSSCVLSFAIRIRNRMLFLNAIAVEQKHMTKSVFSTGISECRAIKCNVMIWKHIKCA